MERTKITLKDNISGKEVTISAYGDTSANIIIPMQEPIDGQGVSQFTFIDEEELGEIISNKFSPGCVLSAPNLTYPLNVSNGYNGGATVDKSYTIPPFSGTKTISTYYEISRHRDFSSIEFSKIITSNALEDLPSESMVNVGLGSSNEVNIGVNDLYYIRCKVFINSYSSSWSNVGSFKFDRSTYLKPLNPEVVEIIEANAGDLYPYIKETSKTGNFPDIRTGEIKFKVSTPKTGLGTPGLPDKIIFTFHTDTTSGLDNSNFKTSVEVEVDCTDSEYYILDLIPHVLYYGKNYYVSYRYHNTKNNVTSPESERVQVFTQPLDLVVNVIDMGIVTELSKISKHKTVNVDDIFFSDRYISKYLYNEAWNNTILLNRVNNMNSEFTMNMVFEGQKEGTTGFIPITNTIVKKITKGSNEYLGTMTYLTTDIDEGFRYDIKLKITFNGVLNGKIYELEFLTDQNIPASDGITGETAETTPRKETTDGYFGYFGEVSGEFNTIEYYGEKSSINPSLFSQGNKFEYIDNNELYVYVNDTAISTAVIDKKVNELTDTEHNTIYGSILPISVEHLTNQIGLKNIKRTTENYTRLGLDGRLTNTIPYTLTSNDKMSYIKCYNKGNQLVYISKYPVSSDIKYKDLRSKFLTGNGSCTFRHGKNIFKSRLLEYAPSPVLGSHYPKKESDKSNVSDDVTLYKNLFGNRLANYFLGDLGIAHDTDITYTNNGFIRTYKAGNVVKNADGELYSSSWDNIDTLEEVDTGVTATTTVKGRIGHYRPVFEYVRESHLPFRLMKTYLPGPTNLTYDKGGDVGYFGPMSSSEFINGNEIIKMLNLTSDNLACDDFYYLKFYYHGRVLFIPTKPMILLNNDTDIEKLVRSGNFFGARDSDDYYFYKNMKYSISTVSYSDRDYTTTANQLEEELGADHKPRKLSSRGMVHMLLSRCFDVGVLSTESGYVNNNPFSLWINDVPELEFDLPVLTSDSLDGEIMCMDKTFSLSKKSDHGNHFYFWPVFTVEALDTSNQLTYGTWNVKPGTITYKTVKVSRKVLTPKTVTRTRPVIKNKVTYEDKIVSQIVKVPNDQISFPKIPKNTSDKYGLILFHALKTDPACDTRKLYQRDKLNVRKSQTGYVLGYSDEYKNMNEFISKSVLVANADGLCPTPLHVSITFRESLACRNYIRDLIQSQVELAVLKNYVPTIPYTDNNNTYPLGILYGCISSMISYYPINPSYDLYNDLENITGDMNLNPLIIEKNGRYQNTWTTMPDDNTVQTIPCLSGFLDFYDYTDQGKEILTNYAKYIAIQNKMPTSQSEINATINTIISTYNFGIVGVDLDTLYIMQDRNGVLTGSYSDPILRKLPADYRLTNYFPTGSKAGFSSGTDFTDIMHPEQGYDDVETSTTIKVPTSVQYVEMESYETTIYEEETIEEEIQVPVYSYVNV